eukprot:515832_1
MRLICLPGYLPELHGSHSAGMCLPDPRDERLGLWVAKSDGSVPECIIDDNYCKTASVPETQNAKVRLNSHKTDIFSRLHLSCLRGFPLSTSTDTFLYEAVVGRCSPNPEDTLEGLWEIGSDEPDCVATSGYCKDPVFDKSVIQTVKSGEINPGEIHSSLSLSCEAGFDLWLGSNVHLDGKSATLSCKEGNLTDGSYTDEILKCRESVLLVIEDIPNLNAFGDFVERNEESVILFCFNDCSGVFDAVLEAPDELQLAYGKVDCTTSDGSKICSSQRIWKRETAFFWAGNVISSSTDTLTKDTLLDFINEARKKVKKLKLA